MSVKSGKSGESQKSDDKKSKVSSKKASTPEKKEEFVVGKIFLIFYEPLTPFILDTGK